MSPNSAVLAVRVKHLATSRPLRHSFARLAKNSANLRKFDWALISLLALALLVRVATIIEFPEP